MNFQHARDEVIPYLCTRLTRRPFPPFVILFPRNNYRPSRNIKGRYAYGISALVFSAVLLCAGVAITLPQAAGAFWPLSVTKADADSVAVFPNTDLPLLDAPINSDPSGALTDPGVTTTSDGSALVAGSDTTGSSTPADTIDDSLSVPSSGTISEYTVKSGDNLSEIAQQFGVSENTILWANNIKNPGSIKEGTTLVILPVSGIQHTVHAGETLSSIAHKYGGDASDIAQFNGLDDGSALQTGSTIIIPGGEISGGSSDTTTKTTTSKTTTKSSAGTTSTVKTTTAKTSTPPTAGSGVTHYSDETGNPYKGGGGAALPGFFVNPLPGALLTQSIHGWNAVDLGAPSGTNIHAAAKGSVVLARTGGWNGGYGNYVIIDNGSGVQTLYAHMTSVGVSVGDSVSAGQTIGTVGTTGDATGPHLHFEVRGARNPFAGCTEMKVCSPE